MSKLYVAYHNTLKMFVEVFKLERNSILCAYMNIPDCAGIIRNFINKFVHRIKDSNNPIIVALVNAGFDNSSCMWMKWRELTYVN